MRIPITVELLSDTCPGSGNGAAGVIDTEVATDAYGIPVIPGRRIKGLFAEAAAELAEFSMAEASAVRKIFGKTGEDVDSAVFETLYPLDYDKLVHFLDCSKKNALWKPYTQKNRVLEYFTSIRSRTAIGEVGVALPNSLHTLRVVNNGTIFRGWILFPQGLDDEQYILLQNCVKLIRHIGLNRTRGMGYVKCTLGDKEEDAVDNKKGTSDKHCYVKDGVLPIHIVLEQPCALGGDAVTGNMLRGLYTSIYSRYKKGITNLHEDSDFYRLFLGNEVTFGYCWPVFDGKVYWPMPKSFVKQKKIKSDNIFDLASCSPDEIEDGIEGTESCKSRYIHLYDNQDSDKFMATVYAPERMEMYHHRRPVNRAIGHATEEDGQLYSRIVYCAHQEFYGEIRGPEELLSKLSEMLPSGSRCYIGASRTAQYGRIALDYDKEYGNGYATADPDNCVVITLLSPMVMMDEYGMESTAAEDVVRTVLGDLPEIDLDKCQIISYCKEEIISGFNRKWNMPLPKRNVLQPGSVIVVYGAEMPADQINKKNNTSYGLYQNEGFGRVWINGHGEQWVGVYDDAVLAQKDELMPDYKDCYPKEFVDHCLLTMLEEQYSDDGFLKDLKRTLEKAPNSHVLSGLQQILKTSDDFVSLSAQLENAAARATKKNSEWYSTIIEKLKKQKLDITSQDNAFRYESESVIHGLRMFTDWKEAMSALFLSNQYRLFQKLFLEMIYTEHLIKREGESENVIE